jgi:hypothetical protein
VSARRCSSARLACFGPVLPAGAFSWDGTGQPLHVYGALACVALALAVVPFAVLTLLTFPSVLPGMLVPRAVRAAWRAGKQHPRCPARLRRAVLAADRGRCVFCGRRPGLQLDHVVPFSLGGLTWLWNLVTLCGRCNRIKSNFWIASDGYVFYRPFRGLDSADLAVLILRAERRARRNPLRWVRAAWALG